VRDARGIAFELDSSVFAMTKHTIASLERPIELLHGDYRALLPTFRCSSAHRLVAFVAAPWGNALNEQTGLDVRRTQPPIPGVIEFIDSVYSDTSVLYVTQVRQPLERGSLAELARRFEWSELHIYDINSDGMKLGVLLGSRRW
jgi:hypothetical protein